mmetsp:Transcript_12977/g.20391  ORF Transcript_12977/g.20391 Transcript_12977/m.20391 type:complete len:126 (+) Transcript_12977:956-1333(+)
MHRIVRKNGRTKTGSNAPCRLAERSTSTSDSAQGVSKSGTATRAVRSLTGKGTRRPANKCRISRKRRRHAFAKPLGHGLPRDLERLGPGSFCLWQKGFSIPQSTVTVRPADVSHTEVTIPFQNVG